MLRSRRGQRLGVDEDADDALALLLTNGVPAAHPRPSEVPPPEPRRGSEPTGHAEQDAADPAPTGGKTPAGPRSSAAPDRPDPDALARRRDGRPSMLSRLSLAPPHHDGNDDDDALKLHDGVSTETREITIAASPARPHRSGCPGGRQGTADRREPARAWTNSCGGSPRRAATRPAAMNPHPADHDAELPERQPAKPKRSSVPSWDEIVFGTRTDWTRSLATSSSLRAAVQRRSRGALAAWLSRSLGLEAQQRNFAFGLGQRTVLAHHLQGRGPHPPGVVEGQRVPGGDHHVADPRADRRPARPRTARRRWPPPG